MSRRARATGLALLLAFAGGARAHTVPPAELVRELNGPAGRNLGVEGATRDEKAPRLLVVRVGAPWYRLSAERRRDEALAWLKTWRDTVPTGLVAVLDARTDRPVVRFGPGGAVVGVDPDPKLGETAP